MNIYQGYNAYVTYLSIKQHFTSDYDYHLYGGKMKVSQESFLKRKDKFFFAKLEKKYKKDELVYFFVSNYVDNFNKRNQLWSGNLVNDKSEDTFNQWKNRIQSLSYKFDQQCQDLFDDQFEEVFEVERNSHPILLKKFLQNQIFPEIMVVLEDILVYIKQWDKKIDEDIIWPESKQLIVKYRPFIIFDKKKYKTILKNIVMRYK